MRVYDVQTGGALVQSVGSPLVLPPLKVTPNGQIVVYVLRWSTALNPSFSVTGSNGIGGVGFLTDEAVPEDLPGTPPNPVLQLSVYYVLTPNPTSETTVLTIQPAAAPQAYAVVAVSVAGVVQPLSPIDQYPPGASSAAGTGAAATNEVASVTSLLGDLCLVGYGLVDDSEATPPAALEPPLTVVGDVSFLQDTLVPECWLRVQVGVVSSPPLGTTDYEGESTVSTAGGWALVATTLSGPVSSGTGFTLDRALVRPGVNSVQSRRVGAST
jgi:hypothetical protein